MTAWIIFQNIGAAVGIIITLITFFSLILKKPKQYLEKLINDANDKSTQEIKERLDKINEKLASADEIDVVTLRHQMTSLYHKYRDEKKIPHYAKEDWLSMYDHYERKGGNSYVHTITKEMSETWEEI